MSRCYRLVAVAGMIILLLLVQLFVAGIKPMCLHLPNKKMKFMIQTEYTQAIEQLKADVASITGIDMKDISGHNIRKLNRLISNTLGHIPAEKTLKRFLEQYQFTEYQCQRNWCKEYLAAFWLKKQDEKLTIVFDTIKDAKDSRQRKKLKQIYFGKYLEAIRLTEPESDNKAIILDSQWGILGDINPVEAHFVDSYWYCYAQDRKLDMIDRHIIYFGEKINDKVNECRLYNANTHYEGYKGVVCMDRTKSFLLVYLNTEKTLSKHLHIKIQLANAVNQTLMIGMDNLIGSMSNTVTSELLIFEKIGPTHKDPTKLTAQFSSKSGRYPQALPKCVADFLTIQQVELFAPTQRVSSLAQLAAFNRGIVHTTAPKDLIAKSYIGKYWIYYKYQTGKLNNGIPETKLDEVTLEIKDDSATSIGVTADLVIDALESYSGAIIKRYNTYLTFYFFEQDKDESVFLQIKIGEKYVPGDMECFSAILTGFHIDASGAASYPAIVVREGVPEFEGKDDSRIKTFFEHEQYNFIETFSIKSFKLNSLIS